MAQTVRTAHFLNAPWKKALWGLLALLGVLIFSAGLWLKFVFFPHLLNPWLPPQMQFAQPSFGPVVGDLGGVAVTIPPYFAEYVEYEGDPGWGEKRQGQRPQRTPASKFVSFGFDVRYPDMAGKSTPEIIEEKRREKLATEMWIHVGINAGRHYSGAGSLDRLAGFINAPVMSRRYPYEHQRTSIYGLEVYTPIGIGLLSRQPGKTHFEDNDIYLGRNTDGRVTTYITCDNTNVPTAPCQHYFSLEPNAHAEIHLHYRRGLLSEWNAIQRKVIHLILSWQTTPPRESASLSASPVTR